MNANATLSGAFIIAADSLAVVINGVNYTISKTSAMYRKVADAVITRDWAKAQEYLEQATALKGEIWWNAEKGIVFYGTEPLHHALSDRLPRMLSEGFDVAPMVAFLKNLFQNPSPHAIEELYEFMEKNTLPITEDGHFLAYKKVREDYKDVHSGTYDNSPGQTLEMSRDLCDPNRHNHCSTGFHFCGLSYLTCFGGERVVIVKVNPKDVTSIPSDYGFAKGRCCRYEVVAEYLGTDVNRYDDAFTTSVAPADWDESEDDLYGDESEDFECDGCGADSPEGCVEPEIAQDAQNLFSKPEETVTTNSTNPVVRARLRAGLTAAQVAEKLGMPESTYKSRVETEGRFFKPSTVAYLLKTIENISLGA